MNDSESRKLSEESLSLNSVQENELVVETSSSSSSTDVKAMEDQIETLKAVVNSLRDEVEKKELGIAKLAREKEQLSLELIRQKRSNSNISKQLEAERKFYFQEKQAYCNEMKEIKALKKSVSKSRTSLDEKPSQELKFELENTKIQLKQTLEANYNLSIKYLRIKNTKEFLRNEMVKMKVEHDKMFKDLRTKIKMMSEELENILNQNSHLFASPSNRKYVQLVRQNSSLVHENLCLHREVNRLNTIFDKVKLKYSRIEINNRLKYIHTNCDEERKEKKKVRISIEDKAESADETSNKVVKSNLKPSKGQSEVIKIFERSKSGDTPTIQIANDETPKKNQKKHKKSCKTHTAKTKSEVSNVEGTAEGNEKEEKPSNKPCVIELTPMTEDESKSVSKNG